MYITSGGTATHSLDYKRSAGGFIHGFRYSSKKTTVLTQRKRERKRGREERGERGRGRGRGRERGKGRGRERDREREGERDSFPIYTVPS